MLALLRQPVTGLRRLALGAGVTTDAQRIVALTGDGLPQGSGFGVFPAANAAVVDATLNGNFETNTTGWTNNAVGGVIARITTDAKFGSACLQTVNDGAGANQGPITDELTGLTPGNIYTYHLRAKSVSGAVTVRLQITWRTVGLVDISDSTSDITLTAAWQHFIITAPSPALGTDAKLLLINLASTAATYNIDGVQFDKGVVALPFDPANTRAAGTVQMPVLGLLTATQGWAFVVFRAGMNSTDIVNGGGAIGFFESRIDNNNRIFLRQTLSASAPLFGVRRTTGTAGTVTVAASYSIGDLVGVGALWNAANVGVSFNGASPTMLASAEIPALAATPLDFGIVDGNSAMAQCSNTLFALVGKGAPAAADWALMNRWRLAAGVPTLTQIAMLSYASKPTCLIPGKTQDAILLPAYFEGPH